jgi:hypothetical protein
MYNHQKQYLKDNYQPKVNLNYCIHCSKKLTGSKKYYCSHQCHHKHIYKPVVRYCSDCSIEITGTNGGSRLCASCSLGFTTSVKYKSQIGWHQRNRASARKTVRNAHIKNRLKATKKLGGCCELEDTTCKGGTKSFFEFHHRNFDGDIDPVRKQGSHAMARDIIKMNKPKSKYQLLCHKHHNEVDTKHNAEVKANESQ